MRIVGGDLRGRKLRAPEGKDIRPTSDRTREAIFNILANGKPALVMRGVKVVDMCCGSGALGLEALSRGAAGATFIDRGKVSLALARRNVLACGMLERANFLPLDVSRLPPPARIAHAPADLLFLDPPYRHDLAPMALLGVKARGWAAPGCVLVIETGSDERFDIPPGYRFIDERVYGAAKVQFLKRSL